MQETCRRYLAAQPETQCQMIASKSLREQNTPAPNTHSAPNIVTALIMQNQPSQTEFAGNASTLHLALSSTSPQLNTDVDWIVDTGATSHMTPH